MQVHAVVTIDGCRRLVVRDKIELSRPTRSRGDGTRGTPNADSLFLHCSRPGGSWGPPRQAARRPGLSPRSERARPRAPPHFLASARERILRTTEVVHITVADAPSARGTIESVTQVSQAPAKVQASPARYRTIVGLACMNSLVDWCAECQPVGPLRSRENTHDRHAFVSLYRTPLVCVGADLRKDFLGSRTAAPGKHPCFHQPSPTAQRRHRCVRQTR